MDGNTSELVVWQRSLPCAGRAWKEPALDLACARDGSVYLCEQEDRTSQELEDDWGMLAVAVTAVEAEWTSETTIEASYGVTLTCEAGCEAFEQTRCDITEDWTGEVD